MNAEETLKRVNELGINPYDANGLQFLSELSAEGYNSPNYTDFPEYKDYIKAEKQYFVEFFGNGLKDVFETEQYGGEGQGDTYYVVLGFEYEDGSTVYLRTDGYYASYQGASDFDDFYIVTKKSKTIEVYEA